MSVQRYSNYSDIKQGKLENLNFENSLTFFTQLMNIILKLRLMSCNSLFQFECVLITFSLIFDKLLTFLYLLFQLWPASGAGGRKQQTSGWGVWASASAQSPEQPGWEGQSGTATESPGQRSSSVWQLTECKTSFEACCMAFFSWWENP